MEVEPSVLVEFIDEMPAMVANWRSSGVATAFAMVAGLAPGKLAETEIVGKSIDGRSLTGNVVKLIMPNSTIADIINVVKMGRLMKRAAKFMAPAR
jgi:hypothetical protein